MDINSYIADLPSVEMATFDEYAKLMQLYILTAKKSDSFEGTKRLLTELYPDNAHFIYELLQNAEDAEASVVKFELNEDMLVFRHNGKKKFTLKDVKGITNIGNSTKKEDHTKVGKFGVGFKSVFALTNKPSIYSEEYNFEIQDMLLPVKINDNPLRKCEETYFEFPFKGDKEQRCIFIEQIEKELLGLNANAIMFLDNIVAIEYSILDKKSGFISKERIDEYVYRIETSSNKEESYWMQFKNHVLDGENDKKSKLHVNISYCVNKNGDSWKVVPIEGNVNIFFPAVKEKSKLRFNINGPFASTVARDSIRDCRENEVLLEKIFELIKESVEILKKRDMLDMAFYEVMPNNEDDLESKYSIIRDRIIDAFNSNQWVLSTKGDYYNATELVKTLPNIQSLFEFETIKEIMGYSEQNWSYIIPLRNKKCRAFFESLNMRNFTYRTMSKMFDDENREKLEQYILNKNIQWLKNFYLVVVEMCDYFQDSKMINLRPIMIGNLKRTKLILSDSGEMKSPEQLYLSTDISIEKKDRYVSKKLSGIEELKVFWNLVGILEFNEIENTKMLLEEIQKYQYPTAEYFSKIIELARYAEKNEIEDIKSQKIWFTDRTNISKKKVNEIYLDEPYDKTGFSNIAISIEGMYPLSHLYYEQYKSQEHELKLFVDFVKSIGIVSEIVIVKTDVRKNPLYHENLYKYSDNVTAHSTGEDYSIMGLDDLLQSNNYEAAKILWNYMIALHTLPRYCKASFSPNRTTVPRKCDSYLIIRLRDSAWIPSKEDNGFYVPADISKEQLPEGFDWDEHSVFLKLVMFSTNKNRVRIQSEKLISEWGVDSNSEQAKALRALLSNPLMATKILNIVDMEEETKYNLTEAIEAQSREALISQEDMYDTNGTVRNVARRSKKIEEELELGIKKPSALKKISFVSRISSSPEERIFLLSQYNGKCQICGATIDKWNGEKYFEGINLLNTKNLDDKIKNTLDIGWNSLCLCPNHAAEYKFGAVDLSHITNVIEELELQDRAEEDIVVTIGMNGNQVKIKYTPKHFLALKTAFAYFVRIEKQ